VIPRPTLAPVQLIKQEISAHRPRAEHCGVHVERAPSLRSQISIFWIVTASILQTSLWRIHLDTTLERTPRCRGINPVDLSKLNVGTQSRESTPFFQISGMIMVQTMMQRADGPGGFVRSHLLRPTFRRSASTKLIFQHHGLSATSPGPTQQMSTPRRPTRRGGIHPCQEGHQVAVFPEVRGRQAAIMKMTLTQCQRMKA
jgi:hypothetical protein